MTPRMRTIQEAAAELRRIDAHTAVTPYFIRRMVLSGAIPHIPTGAENAINTKTLLQDSGLRSVRALRKEIHRLRERGHIICASTDPPTGYYIAADRQEAARFVRSMESRRREIGRAIKAAKKYIEEAGEQLDD